MLAGSSWQADAGVLVDLQNLQSTQGSDGVRESQQLVPLFQVGGGGSKGK